MLLDSFRAEVPFNPYVNTGTLLDLATGKFRPAINGGWVLDGGLSQCMGVTGRAQTYKSTLASSFLVRAMEIHPTAEAYIYESENAVADVERYDAFVSVPNSKVSNRIVFKNSTVGNLSDFYADFSKIVDEKIKHKDDYLVDSPFLNPDTGKAHKVWIPTFVMVDSFSRAKSGKSEQQYETNAIDDSSLNNLFLMDGNFKTRIMNDLPSRASKAGIYVILTAHMGNKMDLNPYAVTPKQLQYMKNTDKMKNVGSNFEFLTTTLLQTLKAGVMQDSSGACEYPSKISTSVEVNRVDTMMIRCKNNASGNQIPFIVSQYQGILNSVTDFLFLKNNKSTLLENKNNRFYNSVLLPDTKFGRTNIRELCDSDYKLKRALELTAHLHFIQNYWSSWGLPDYCQLPVEQFVEKLTSDSSLIDRVLTSTSSWTTAPDQQRERLTILDILQLLSAEK